MGYPSQKFWTTIHRSFKYDVDGSCMMVVMTDAPLDARNLERLAKRAMMGLARTGGIASNGSGDYVIAVSTAAENRISYQSSSSIQEVEVLRNAAISPLFLATIEATEEAIINSLFAGRDHGRPKMAVEQNALPVIEKVLRIMHAQKEGESVNPKKIKQFRSQFVGIYPLISTN